MNKYKEFLERHGWTEKRQVSLPQEYYRYDMGNVAKTIIANLYGLTFKEKAPNSNFFYERTFLMQHESFDFFDEYLQEAIEDYELKLKLYPLGKMSEFSGYIAIDDYGNFFFCDGGLWFYGKNLHELLDVIVFSTHSAIAIDYPDSPDNRYKLGSQKYLLGGLRRTYYGNNGIATQWLYDKNVGLVPYPEE